MEINSLKNKIEGVQDKGYTTGLDFYDLKKLKGYRKALGAFDQKDPKIQKLSYQIDYMINEMVNAGLNNRFTRDNFKYISKNSDLLPLVLGDAVRYANDVNISWQGNNSAVINCPFHDDEDNSFIIMDAINKFGCNSCDTTGDTIQYVNLFNKLGISQSIELLCYIYNFKIPYHNENLEYLAGIYKRSFEMPLYKEMLEDGEDRMYAHGVYNLDNGTSIEDVYRMKRERAERIIDGDYDPDFVYEERPKLILKSKK